MIDFIGWGAKYIIDIECNFAYIHKIVIAQHKLHILTLIHSTLINYIRYDMDYDWFVLIK
jgi:hypothetical protein